MSLFDADRYGCAEIGCDGRLTVRAYASRDEIARTGWSVGEDDKVRCPEHANTRGAVTRSIMAPREPADT